MLLKKKEEMYHDVCRYVMQCECMRKDKKLRKKKK